MKSTTKYTKKHLLGHKSVLSLKTMYKILKEGYLKPGSQVGQEGLWGQEEVGMDFIFLMFFDIGYGRLMQKTLKKDKFLKTCDKPNYLFNPELLLDRITYLNMNWRGNKHTNSIKINGKKIDNIDKKVKELRKIITSNKNFMVMFTHEFLIKKKINLKKYLKKIVITDLGKNKKEKEFYNKIIDILKKNYPNTEVYTKTFYEKKEHCITRKLKI